MLYGFFYIYNCQRRDYNKYNTRVKLDYVLLVIALFQNCNNLFLTEIIMKLCLVII